MKLIGDNHSRHGDWREMMFEITLCVPNIDKKKTCVENPLEELKKMELIFLYNSERFNRKDFSLGNTMALCLPSASLLKWRFISVWGRPQWGYH